MKDKIIEVIDNNISTPFAEHEFDSLVDKITALMCYREVRAYIMSRMADWPLLYLFIEKKCIGLLIADYSEDIILKAIEQVKTEQK